MFKKQVPTAVKKDSSVLGRLRLYERALGKDARAL